MLAFVVLPIGLGALEGNPERAYLHGRRIRISLHAGGSLHLLHRRSYVCETGVGDVLIAAAATVADYNGVEKASHIRDKQVEMTHLNETIYGMGIAASCQGVAMKSGVYLPDDILANICKHYVAPLSFEIGRLAHDSPPG